MKSLSALAGNEPAPRLLPVHPGCCAVCRRIEVGAGYAPFNLHTRDISRIIWTCDAHIPLAREIYTMKPNDLTEIEQDALMDAGDAAGQYLDGLQKTDIATMTEAEWREFLRLIVDGFGKSIAMRLEAGQAPF